MTKSSPSSIPLQTKDITIAKHHVSSDTLLILPAWPVFRWNDLPGELKNRIYEACLTTSGTVSIDSYYKIRNHSRVRGDNKVDEHRLCREVHHTDARPRNELVPNLLHVNKQTYREGAPLLYDNHLKFLSTHAFGHFMLKNEANGALESIKHITVCKWTDTREAPWHVLATKVTNLQTLTLGEVDYFPLLPLSALIFATEYGRMWFNGVGTNKAERCAAIDRMIRLSFENTARFYGGSRREIDAEELMKIHLLMEYRFRAELKRSM
ncbi:hypothetical protein SLS56_006173 [Neofusicoccum ribis]|uniref:Uncharacterized protein n=1 Tax=Neofusicoccum ribis TaxID=45134 RepID=A0ABR3SRH0_9PEZI